MSPHRAALQITSPNHPFAYFVYGAQVVLGVLLAAGVITIISLERLLLLPVAGLIMASGGAVALYAITKIPKAVAKDPPLRLEQVAAWVVCSINAVFTVAMSIAYGVDTAVPTKVYAGGIAIVCLARAVQIRRQRRRLRAALAAMVPAAPQLAERRDIDR